MGISCCKGYDDELNEVTKTLEEKSPDIVNESLLKKKVIDLSKEELLKERSKDIENLLANNSSNEDIKKKLKEYNLKELEIEKDYFKNELDKMHSLYELGLELADPAKNVIIKQLEKKKPPCFERIVSKLKQLSPKEFLNSKFGKPLKKALEKQGMSKTILIDKKDELLEDRKKRREEEKTKYKLEQNEFPPDDDFNIDTDEIYEDMFEDYAKINQKFGDIYEKYKIIENIQKISKF